MSKSNTINRDISDIKILVDVSEKTLSVYKAQSHLVDRTVLRNQKNIVKFYRDMLRAKEEELSYNKDESQTSEK